MYEYTRKFTDKEIEMLGCDPKEWMDKAIEGKLNKCKKRKLKDILNNHLDEVVKLAQKLEKKEDKSDSGS